MRYLGRQVPRALALAVVLALGMAGSAHARPGICVKVVQGAAGDALVYAGQDADAARVSIQGVAAGAAASNDGSAGPGYELSTSPVAPECVKPPCRVETVGGVPDPTYVFCPAREGVPQAVKVTTGDGPDAVDLWDAVSADVTVATRGGDDRVGFDLYLPGRGPSPSTVAVATGPGNDALTIGLCERLYYAGVTAAMGAGEDSVLLGRGEGTLGTGCAASIDGGAGDDDITTWSFGEVLGGGGADTIRGNGTNLGRPGQAFVYDGGAGPDHIVDRTLSFPFFAGATPVRIRGGLGPDVIDGGGAPLFDSSEPGTGIPDDIDCGPGRDVAAVYPGDLRVGCEAP